MVAGAGQECPGEGLGDASAQGAEGGRAGTRGSPPGVTGDLRPAAVPPAPAPSVPWNCHSRERTMCRCWHRSPRGHLMSLCTEDREDQATSRPPRRWRGSELSLGWPRWLGTEAGDHRRRGHCGTAGAGGAVPGRGLPVMSRPWGRRPRRSPAGTDLPASGCLSLGVLSQQRKATTELSADQGRVTQRMEAPGTRRTGQEAAGHGPPDGSPGLQVLVE